MRSSIRVATSRLVAGTVAFSYNAEIADSGVTVKQQWFEVRGFRQSSNGTTSGTMYVRIGSSAVEPTATYEGTLTDSHAFLYVTQAQTSAAGFAINTAQTLNTVRTGTMDVNTLGGECVVTYEYSNASATKTRTARLFLGQSASGGGTSGGSN